MPDYTLSAKITGDSSGYQKAIKEADQATDNFQENTSSLSSRLAGGLKKGLSITAGAIAGVTTALGAGTVAGVKYNATIEQYQTSFEVMTGSAEKAADVVDRLKKLGAETPFEMPQLAEVTQLLMNYGFTADEAIDRMQMLGDISQGSADKMQRIATAYGQMSSAGKVQLEDVKQMIEAGFNPLQEISESTGESMQSLYDRISSGTLAVDEITASMQRATSEGGKYYQSMEKQSQTITGMISTLKDNAQQLLGEVVQPITESFGARLLPAAIDAIDQLTTAFQQNGVDGLIAVGGQIITNILLGIAQGLPNVISTAIQIIQSVVTNLQANMPQIITAGGQILMSLITGIASLLPSLGSLALSIITQIGASITQNAPQLIPKGVDALLQFIRGIISNLPQIISTGLQVIVSLAQGIANSLPTLIAEVPKIINEFCANIDSLLPQILGAGIQIIVALGKGIIQSIPAIIANAGEIVTAILNVITHLNLFSAGANIIKGLGNGIKSIFGEIGSIIKNLINNIKNPFKINWSSIGTNIIRGIANGISGAVGTIVSAAKRAAQSAFNAAKRFLGIRSPSTLFRDEVGRYMALGMGIGFEDNIPIQDINGSLDSAVNKISGHYAEVGQRINPVDAITGTSRVAETYQADVSNIFEGVTIIVDNTTNLDGTPIYKNAARYTISEIGNQQKAVLKARGAFA
ncbi:MAG: tape measure protein [Lachnospiraceae bacterium]|nr:tape measure protein [Lachnospiraceae bacterium]MBS5469700.1 tape measure protein [Clostridium sp.]